MFTRRITSFILSFAIALSLFAQGTPKYVFYFIGDGMGVNQVNGTETYLAALEGRIGVKPLLFTSFPAVGLATTFSATNGVTDSAAAGTALATGEKTKNGAIGVLADQKTPASSVATWAKDAGAAVGVATSVSVDHATPAAFYAHVGGRNSYYSIGKHLIEANFDFYAGSDFMEPVGSGDLQKEGTLYAQCEDAGYRIARGVKDFDKKFKKGKKMILFQTEEASKTLRKCLQYAIDRKAEDLTLAQITEAGIKTLASQRKDGFFLMIEGGKIDWACHSNDAATTFHEIIDMDQAIKVAYEFYKQHPDETLIVVTADHETGGIALGRGPYELHTDVFQHQKISVDMYALHLEELIKSQGTDITWETIEADLKANWGFWDKIKLNDGQTARLKRAFEKVVAGKDKGEQSLYSQLGGIATEARNIIHEIALVGWQSGGHSNGFVPVFAIGAGAEEFVGKYDNTEIPKRIGKVTGWKK